MATNDVSKLYEQFENKELANLIYNILIYKSDYDHNHDDKYAKLENVYTKEEVENILNVTTLSLKEINDFELLDNKINKAIIELKNIDTNISNYLEAINKVSILETEIQNLKEEKENIKQKLSDVEIKYNNLASKIKPLLDVSEPLIYSANNIINFIKYK